MKNFFLLIAGMIISNEHKLYSAFGWLFKNQKHIKTMYTIQDQG